MTRLCWLVALATFACKSSEDPQDAERKRADERFALLDSMTRYCEDGAITAVPGLGTYNRAATRHGVVAIERDDKTWSSVGAARPAGAAAPRDPAQIEAIACIDKTWLHEIERCTFYDDRGLAAASFQRGRSFAKIRFVDARTGALLVETTVDSTAQPKPCPTMWAKGDDTSPWLTPVKEADTDAVLERFRTGALVPASK